MVLKLKFFSFLNFFKLKKTNWIFLNSKKFKFLLFYFFNFYFYLLNFSFTGRIIYFSWLEKKNYLFLTLHGSPLAQRRWANTQLVFNIFYFFYFFYIKFDLFLLYFFNLNFFNFNKFNFLNLLILKKFKYIFNTDSLF